MSALGLATTLSSPPWEKVVKQAFNRHIRFPETLTEWGAEWPSAVLIWLRTLFSLLHQITDNFTKSFTRNQLVYILQSYREMTLLYTCYYRLPCYFTRIVTDYLVTLHVLFQSYFTRVVSSYRDSTTEIQLLSYFTRVVRKIFHNFTIDCYLNCAPSRALIMFLIYT